MKLSKTQQIALVAIKKMAAIIGKDRIFTKYEVSGITDKTLYALCQRGYLEYLRYNIPNICYYKILTFELEGGQ